MKVYTLDNRVLDVSACNLDHAHHQLPILDLETSFFLYLKYQYLQLFLKLLERAYTYEHNIYMPSS